MGLRLLFWLSREERKALDELRGLKTLKVTRGGGMSVDPGEIQRCEGFREASRRVARLATANR